MATKPTERGDRQLSVRCRECKRQWQRQPSGISRRNGRFLSVDSKRAKLSPYHSALLYSFGAIIDRWRCNGILGTDQLQLIGLLIKRFQ